MQEGDFGTFGGRLAAALAAAKKSRSELAAVLKSPNKDELGVSVQAIGQVLRGDSGAMNAENTIRAANFLRVESLWLATGEGQQASTGAKTALLDDEEDLLLSFRRLPPALKQEVLRDLMSLALRHDQAATATMDRHGLSRPATAERVAQHIDPIDAPEPPPKPQTGAQPKRRMNFKKDTKS